MGVEGISKEVIKSALEKSGVISHEISEKGDKITKNDMYFYGLSGSENSSEKRKDLLKFLNLPLNLSPNIMLDVINTLYTKEEFEREVEKCRNLQDKN